MTPLLRPLWWAPTAGSFSRTVTRSPGSCRSTAAAVASPTMPAPITARSRGGSIMPGSARTPGSEVRRLGRLPVLPLRGGRGDVSGRWSGRPQLLPLDRDEVVGHAGSFLDRHALGHEHVLRGVRPDGVVLVVEVIAVSVRRRLLAVHVGIAERARQDGDGAL